MPKEVPTPLSFITGQVGEDPEIARHLELIAACLALPVLERHETLARRNGHTARMKVIKQRREQLEAIVLGVAPDDDE